MNYKGLVVSFQAFFWEKASEQRVLIAYKCIPLFQLPKGSTPWKSGDGYTASRLAAKVLLIWNMDLDRIWAIPCLYMRLSIWLRNLLPPYCPGCYEAVARSRRWCHLLGWVHILSMSPCLVRCTERPLVQPRLVAESEELPAMGKESAPSIWRCCSVSNFERNLQHPLLDVSNEIRTWPRSLSCPCRNVLHFRNEPWLVI